VARAVRWHVFVVYWQRRAATQQHQWLQDGCKVIAEASSIIVVWTNKNSVANKNEGVAVAPDFSRKVLQLRPILGVFSLCTIASTKGYSACGRTIILGGEDRRQSTNYVL
jgi:hypothetical protein